MRDRPQGRVSSARCVPPGSQREQLYELALPRIKSLIRKGSPQWRSSPATASPWKTSSRCCGWPAVWGERDAAHPGQDHAAGGPCGAAGVPRRSRPGSRPSAGDHPAAAEAGLAGCGGCLLRAHRLLPCPDRAGLSGGGSGNLAVKGHGSALQPGGSTLAAHFGALSVDHLEYLDPGRDPGAGPPWRGRHPAAHRLPSSRRPSCPRSPPCARRGRWLSPPTSTRARPPSSPLRMAMNMACTLFGLTPVEAMAG